MTIKCVISNNQGGLSNRMKSLISAIRYSVHHNIDYYVNWPILNSYSTHNHILNCKFESLFKNNIIINIDNDDNDNLSSITYNSHCFLILNKDNIPTNFNNFKSKCPVSFSKNDSLNRNIDFMYNEIPTNLLEEYKNYFKILQPIDSIQSKINTYSNSNFNDNTISVHIRSWSRNGENSRRNALFNIKMYENKLISCIENADNLTNLKFFLASDSSDVIDYFTNKSTIKEYIITYPRKTKLDISRDIPEGVQEDLIELYLLGKNKKIIGSHFSTYTEVAWYLAGCPKDITIISP